MALGAGRKALVSVITVVTCTFRVEPQFAWIADSLARCSARAPGVLLEWLVIDGRLWYDELDRRAQVRAAVNGRYPVNHVAPKPTRWQGPNRSTQRDFFALSNARNTALLVARGSHLAFVDDCSVLDAEWLARHSLWASQGRGVAGTFRSYQQAVVENGQIVQGDDGPYGWDKRRGDRSDPRPARPGWAYGLNMSVPLDVALEIDGWDEMYDGQAGSEDCDFAVRSARAGCQYMFDPQCIVFAVLGTHTAVCNSGDKTGGSKLPVPGPKEARLRDGRMHFCNELLIQNLLDDSKRKAPAATWFGAKASREEYERTGALPSTPLGPELYWLDNEPLTEMP